MKIKTLVFLVIFVLLVSGNINAQGIIDKGIIAGLNLSNLTGDDVDDEFDLKPGLCIGGYFTYQASNQFLLRPELTFSMKGAKSTDSGTETDWGETYSYEYNSVMSLNYLDATILAMIPIGNIKIFAGPYLGIYLNGKSKFDYEITYDGDTESDSETEDIDSDEIKIPEFGICAGAEYSINQISIGARYSLGLTDVPDEDDVDMKNTVIQIVFGYSF